MNWRKMFKEYDFFAKAMEDVTTQTFFGGLISVLTAILMILLVAFEFSRFMQTQWTSELIVDTSSNQEQMEIHFDISFPKIPCFVVTLDIMDAAQEHQTNIAKSVKKHRLDSDGEIIEEHVRNAMKSKTDLSASKKGSTQENCGSCYSATSVGLFGLNCCNTCEDVQEAYRQAGLDLPEDLNTFEQCHREDWSSMIATQRNEGCRLNGSFKVNKIPGNFHFAPGYSFQLNNMHAHDLRPFPSDMTFDFSHHIHYLTFGEEHLDTRRTPLTNPLKDYASTATGEQMYTYFIKVVPTEFHFMNTTRILTHQYSASEHHRDTKGGNGLTGAYFNLEVSPMMVTYHESSPSWSTFITQCCAIIGGVYTIATLTDSLIYSAEKRFLHKQSLGKAT